MRLDDPEAVGQAIRVKDAAVERLMAIPGVHAVGVGPRYRGGQRTDELALLVRVDRKRPPDEISPGEAIPADINGLPTDVQEAERAEFRDDQAKYRPLRGGCRLQWTLTTHPAPNTTVTSPFRGTLACAALARRTGKTVLLTNAHVVAGCDDPSVAIGRRIGQPDDESDHTCCSKSWATVVGTVVDARKHPANPDVDVALIELDKCVDTQPQVIGVGAIHGALGTPQLNVLSGTPVRWRGHRTAGIRQGTVDSVSLNSSVMCKPADNLPGVPHPFTDAISVRTPTTTDVQPGDSGSLVMDGAGNVVGLLFGAAGDIAYVCRWDRILTVFQEKWDLQLLTNPGIDVMADVAPSPPRLLGAAGPAGHRAVFSPSAAEMALLESARDEVLASPEGSRLVTLVSRHADEIRRLIGMQKRVAAVWHRVATPELPHATLAALRDPARPLAELVEGAPLAERIEALRTVLARYGSPELRADLAAVAPLALELSAGSAAELRAWLRTAAARAA